MSLKRVWVLLSKELATGARNVMFLFAILAPLLISLVLSLVFGFFAAQPKLGIADEGASRLVPLAAQREAVLSQTYSSVPALEKAVRAGAVDVGIVLPADFDRAIAGGQETRITALIWGQSLAQNRVIVEAIVTDMVLELAGREAPVEIALTSLGGEETGDTVPLNDRMLPLIILMAVFLGGSLVPATSLVEEKQRRTLRALTVTATTLEEVFLSKGLVGILIGLSMGVLMLVLNQAFGSQAPLLLLVLVLGALIASALGVLLGILIKDVTSLFATIKLLAILLYAPALVYLFPQIPEWVGQLFPTYYVIKPVVDISQRGAAWPDVQFEVLVLIGEVVLLTALVAVAARRARWAR